MILIIVSIDTKTNTHTCCRSDYISKQTNYPRIDKQNQVSRCEVLEPGERGGEICTKITHETFDRDFVCSGTANNPVPLDPDQIKRQQQ